MKTLFTTTLLICTVALGFGQMSQTFKRYGYAMSVPSKWEIDKRKDQTIISDPNWEVFVTLREFSIKKEDDMLKDVTAIIYEELENYVPKDEIDKEMQVEPDKNSRGQEFLKMTVTGGLDEDNQMAVYEARLYKNKNETKVLMVTVLDFGEAMEIEGHILAGGKHYLKTNGILSSLRLD